MNIELKPGESVTVSFEGTDGQYEIGFAQDMTLARYDGVLVHKDTFCAPVEEVSCGAAPPKT